MSKLWTGRFTKEIDSIVNDFNSSISFDKKMYKEDILGSIAHVTMLGECNIISLEESKKIVVTLEDILIDIENNKLNIDETSEDIHSFIEGELTLRLGDTGKRLHTARSRNDQVALDIRMYIKKSIKEIYILLIDLVDVIKNVAEENKNVIMPSYTHLQRAQPINFAHHLLAYTMMFIRDIDRLNDTYKRTNILPLGSAALAGTTYPINRHRVQELLGFYDVCQNSLDGVSDRDFLVELSACLSLIMVHLSRFSEEIILWCSWEFKFIELDDSFSTGSSIMPQKKNPDIAELVRGKSGRVFGDLMSLLTMLKGLPLAYNKDMQEDKEAIFDGVDTVIMCLKAFTPMIKTMKINEENMKNAASKGFINATDCADYLTKKGLPFREAYKITGIIVNYCIQNNKTLETLSIDEYKSFNNTFENDIYNAIDLRTCINERISFGGPSIKSINTQIEYTNNKIEEYKSIFKDI